MAREIRKAVDTCVFLNVMTLGQEDNPDWFLRSQRVIDSAIRGDYQLIISPLVIAELAGNGKVRGAHLDRRTRQERVARVRDWISNAGFMLVELDGRIAHKAADIAIKNQLRGPDAVILASALAAEATDLFTWDTDLLKLDGAYDLKIRQPLAGPEDGQLDLYGSVEAGQSI